MRRCREQAAEVRSDGEEEETVAREVVSLRRESEAAWRSGESLRGLHGAARQAEAKEAMSDFDREDYQDLEQRVDLARARQIGARIDLLVQAEIAAENLTRDPHWDAFLQVLQQSRNDAAQRLEDLRAGLTLTAPNELHQLQMEAAVTEREIETLDRVIALPARMREAGQEARRSRDVSGNS